MATFNGMFLCVCGRVCLLNIVAVVHGRHGDASTSGGHLNVCRFHVEHYNLT